MYLIWMCTSWIKNILTWLDLTWLCRIGKFLFCMRKDFNYLCHVRMLWIIDIFFMFPMKNVACKGLRHTDFWWIAINALLCWRYGYDTDIRSSIIFTLIVTCIFFRDPKHIYFIFHVVFYMCVSHMFYLYSWLYIRSCTVYICLCHMSYVC